MSASLTGRPAIWPREAEPYELWSLLDMIHIFSAGDLAGVLINLERAAAFTDLILNPPPAGATQEGLLRTSIPRYQATLGALVESIAQLPVSLPVQLQVRRLLEHVADPRLLPDYASVAAQARQARQAVIDDLGQHLFLCVPAKDRAQYEQEDPPFGNAFPGCVEDAKAAGRCLALSEWTACVFHSMRLIEHGLTKLAARFGVPFTTDSWHKIISGIEDGIDGMRNKPGLTAIDREEITRLSDAATQFRYFKDAWRNHAFHARASYDERGARAIYEHVRAFMDTLARP